MNCTVIYRTNEPASARFMVKGQDIEAKMVDISQGGMAMVTNCDIPVETRLSMRFTMLKVESEVVNFTGPVEVNGQVRSNVAIPQEGHRLGINFTRVKRIGLPV
jgi:hypothetical protein